LPLWWLRFSLDRRGRPGSRATPFGDPTLDERRAEDEPARQQSTHHEYLIEVSRPHHIADVHVDDCGTVLVGEPSTDARGHDHQQQPDKDHAWKPSREPFEPCIRDRLEIPRSTCMRAHADGY
jgi:hypothetical protein